MADTWKLSGELVSEYKLKFEVRIRQRCDIGSQIYSLIFDRVCKEKLSAKYLLAYAYDLLILAKSEQQALSKLKRLNLEAENAGMDISFPKIELMTSNVEGA